MNLRPGIEFRWPDFVAASASLLLLTTACAYAELAAAPNGVVEWRRELSEPFLNDIALGDSALYVAAGNQKASLFAYTLDGELLWDFSPDPRPLSDCPMAGFAIQSVAVGPDGKVFAGGGDGMLYVLDSSGELLWKYDTEPEVRSPLHPFLHPDGRLFSLNSRGELFAYDVDGRVLMQIRTGRHVFWQQQIQWDAQDRFRVVDVQAQEVVCFADDGSVVWSTPLPGKVYQLSYGPNDVVSAIVNWEDVYCIGSGGNILWSSAGCTGDPVFDSTGRLYVPAGNAIQVLSTDGSVLSEIGPRRDLEFGGVTIHDGKLYVEGYPRDPDHIASYHCFNLDGLELWSIGLDAMPRPLTHPAFDNAGNVYLPLLPEVEQLDTGEEVTGEALIAASSDDMRGSVVKAHGPAG